MNINVSWYLNSDPDSGLNPLLSLLIQIDEENKAIISWADENGIG